MASSCERCMLACRITNWHPKLRGDTFKSFLVPLSDEFIEYLRSDGMQLPLAPEGTSLKPIDPRFPRPTKLTEFTEGESERESTCADDDDSSSNTSAPAKEYCFPEIEGRLQELLAKYEHVFVKSEWSAPMDAVWAMHTGTAKCSTPGDIYMLLKASDLVQHDLQVYDAIKAAAAAGADGIATVAPLHLVVRPWYLLHRSCEFRCFVRENRLVGICQRKSTEYFEHLLSEKAETCAAITDFFALIKGDMPLSNYVMDVYVDRKFRVRVMDIAPIGGTTSPLLFEWQELYGCSEPTCCGVAAAGDATAGAPELRIVEDARMRYPELAVHKFPDDAARWTAETGKSFAALLQQLAEDK